MNDVFDGGLVGVVDWFAEIDAGRIVVVLVDGVGSRGVGSVDQRHSGPAIQRAALASPGGAEQMIAFVAAFQLDDRQAIGEQHANQSVLAGEEHVRIAQDAVFEDQQHPQHEERCVLHHYRYDDAVDVRRTARIGRYDEVHGLLSGRQQTRAVFALFGGSKHKCELHQAPRPERQYQHAQHTIVTNLDT